MAKTKNFDGVIEAAHYAPNGQIEWVRAYLRKGFVFTDVMLLDRPTLLKQLKDGARFYTGKRKPYLGNVFELAQPVRVEGRDSSERIVAGNSPGKQDNLEGAPLF